MHVYIARSRGMYACISICICKYRSKGVYGCMCIWQEAEVCMDVYEGWMDVYSYTDYKRFRARSRGMYACISICIGIYGWISMYIRSRGMFGCIYIYIYRHAWMNIYIYKRFRARSRGMYGCISIYIYISMYG